MSEHAKDFPPSGAWGTCSQWVSSSGSSVAARTGALRHALLLDGWLVSLLAGADWTPPTSMEIDGYMMEVTPTDLEAAEKLHPYFESHPAVINNGKPGYHVWVEQKVHYGTPLGFTDPEEHYGRMDAGLMTPTTLEGFDAKFGHFLVSPTENDQLKRYMLGLGTLVDWQGDGQQLRRLKLTIGQPETGKPPLTWDQPLDVLPKWAEEQKKQIASRWSTYTPGDACKFCAKAGTCAARAGAAAAAVTAAFEPVPLTKEEEESQLKMVGEAFEVLDDKQPAPLAPVEALEALEKTQLDKDPTDLDNAALGRVVAAADQMIAFLKSAQKEAQRRASAGQKIPGNKLVAGRRSRILTIEEAEFERVLVSTWRIPKFDTEDRAGIYSTKRKGLAEIEKLVVGTLSGVRQKKFADMWAMKEGKQILVPDTDPRPEIATVTFEPVPDVIPEWM